MSDGRVTTGHAVAVRRAAIETDKETVETYPVGATDKENRISLSVAGGKRLFGMARAH